MNDIDDTRTEQLYKSHEKLIYCVLHNHRIHQGHYLWDDCLSAGRVGLMTAIRSWQPKRAKLCTHCYYQIRRQIQDAIGNSHLINMGRYQTAIRRSKKHGVLSLDYLYSSPHDEHNKSPLVDFLYLHKIDNTADSYEKIIKAVKYSCLTQTQKQALREYMRNKSLLIDDNLKKAVVKIRNYIKRVEKQKERRQHESKPL